MFISFTRKYNRLLCPLLIWEHVLCWSRLSHNIVTRSTRLEPTFPRSTHFAAELILNNRFQRGRSLHLTFQRGEHCFELVNSTVSSPACLPQRLRITKPEMPLEDSASSLDALYPAQPSDSHQAKSTSLWPVPSASSLGKG